MGVFRFEPIGVDASAPGGARVLRTFDDVTAFIADSLDTPRRQLLRWQTVLADLSQARFGARRPEAHAAVRDALAQEGWLAR